MCGDNTHGQCGVGNEAQNYIAQPQKVTGFPNPIQQVSCGLVHTLVLETSGSVFGMGDNRMQQMGLENSPFSSNSSFRSPIKVSCLEKYDV